MSRIISTDVPDDLGDRIEEEREQGESRSAATRRLIRAGLDAQEPTWRPIPALTALFGFGLIALAAEPPGDPRFYAGLGAVLLVLTFSYAAVKNLRGDW